MTNLAGVFVPGEFREETIVSVEALALRVLADRFALGDGVPEAEELFSAPTC